MMNMNDSVNGSLDLSMFGDVGVSQNIILENSKPYIQIPVDLSKIPKVDNDTLVMIIEQLLMLLLIIGRWMLPKVRMILTIQFHFT